MTQGMGAVHKQDHEILRLCIKDDRKKKREQICDPSGWDWAGFRFWRLQLGCWVGTVQRQNCEYLSLEQK